eukprot:scaffold133312_cov64-Phaeocystis_antarctica.AAC.4
MSPRVWLAGGATCGATPPRPRRWKGSRATAPPTHAFPWRTDDEAERGVIAGHGHAHAPGRHTTDIVHVSRYLVRRDSPVRHRQSPVSLVRQHHAHTRAEA